MGDTPLDHRLEDLELSVRTSHVLQEAGLVYVGELVQWTEKDLLKQPSSGRKVMNELQEFLANWGLALGAEHPEWSRPDGEPIVRP
ncbi:DNA-directed RNA polymerase subunit alpha C-terminal domain-containing protein [Nannocystis sp. SCPEA4]|uniref:DNA-directed RNA polymerase subunit alpha C-terminal domain-containing protein n=1 Tax=Nannocystis sp. SCPEA4 TaxID=2996787 RepID=UPI00226F41E1|nr:DNA-directed RNA polymerase subunit alpha C-terminal domain-containing protein [Nannocystis sp. SCPEA4]MCY1060847.1 hypothetical protein [Nannocystis sp. SCPEA4]